MTMQEQYEQDVRVVCDAAVRWDKAISLELHHALCRLRSTRVVVVDPDMGNRIHFAVGSLDVTNPPQGGSGVTTKAQVDGPRTNHNCVAIPKDEYDRLRRALLELMYSRGYPRGGFGAGALPVLVSIGLVAGVKHGDDDGVGTWDWTPAAHEFAREMEGEK
jgi:hypothetical protein